MVDGVSIRCISRDLLPQEAYAASTVFSGLNIVEVNLFLSDDDDYDIDFFTADPVPHEGCDSIVPKPSPREQLEFLVTTL